METTILHRSLASTPPLLTINSQKFLQISQNQIFFPRRHHQAFCINPNNGAGTDEPPPITPPEPAEVRFRRRSRRRSKQESDEEAIGNGRSKKKQMENTGSEAPKKWEDMSIAEKAMELYMGEKGLLFWLNKFAYASIFIVIGGWILFRFVGPSLNLYQLDTPPLSPASIFKG